MASKSLNIPHRFAAGTIVRAYPRDATVPNEPPDSNSLDQATVAADGTLTFTNLPSDAYLTAFARVDGEYRYFPFTVGDPSLGSSESSRALPAATGTDDTAALQGVLNSGGHVIGRPGAAYIISAPLVVSSGMTLDLTGCTVTLKAGTGGNMLVNPALSAARSVIDAAITTGTNVLTSATAAFVAGDAGKDITIVGAGANQVRLKTTIQSVTNATTVVLAANAGTTVTNGWATIGTRDANITLIGGLWDRGSNGSDATGKGYSNNSIRLRRVDGLRVRDVELASTGGKYGVNIGDAWDFRVSGVHGRTTFSDIVHVNGPASHFSIRDTTADNAGDDLVSLTAADFNTVATMADICGDITDGLVDGVSAAVGTRRGAIIIAGTAPAALGGRAVAVNNVTVRGVRGLYPTGASVNIGGDFQDAATIGGTYSGILVEDVKSETGSVSTSTVTVPEGTFEDLTIRDVVAASTHDRPVNLGGVNATASVTIKRLVVDGVSWTGGTAPNGVVTLIRGTVTSLIISKARVTTANTGATILSLATTTPVTVSRAVISDCDLENATGGNASMIVHVGQATNTLTTVELANCHTKNVTYVLGRYYSTTRVKATNIHAEGASSGIRVEAAGVVTLEANNIDTNADGFSFAAGGSLRLLGFGCRGDLATTGIAKNSGDMAFNTNAGNGLTAAGPCICNGTNWKHIYAGTTI